MLDGLRLPQCLQRGASVTLHREPCWPTGGHDTGLLQQQTSTMVPWWGPAQHTHLSFLWFFPPLPLPCVLGGGGGGGGSRLLWPWELLHLLLCCGGQSFNAPGSALTSGLDGKPVDGGTCGHSDQVSLFDCWLALFAPFFCPLLPISLCCKVPIISLLSACLFHRSPTCLFSVVRFPCLPACLTHNNTNAQNVKRKRNSLGVLALPQ